MKLICLSLFTWMQLFSFLRLFLLPVCRFHLLAAGHHPHSPVIYLLCWEISAQRSQIKQTINNDGEKSNRETHQRRFLCIYWVPTSCKEDVSLPPLQHRQFISQQQAATETKTYFIFEINRLGDKWKWWTGKKKIHFILQWRRKHAVNAKSFQIKGKTRQRAHNSYNVHAVKLVWDAKQLIFWTKKILVLMR